MASFRPRARAATRHRRVATAALVAAATALGPTALAAADGASPGGSLDDQATALVAQIQAENLRSDQLSEQVDAARIQVAQIGTRLQAAQAAIATTDVALKGATALLTQEAVAAYMQSGRPLSYVPPHDTADDPALIQGYSSSVVGIQHSTVGRWQQLRHQEAAQTASLAAAEAAATASEQQLEASQHQAQAAANQAEATLTQVQSQPTLAAAVTQDQAAQASQTAQTVEARFDVTSSGAPARVAAASPATAPSSATAAVPTGAASSAGTATVGSSAAAPSSFGHAAPTTAAPTTAAPTQPRSTAPAPTSPATTAPAPTTGPAPSRGVLGSASTAIAYAEAQIGKPYAWGGAGPTSFDCSGLVMEAWAAAGVSFPHSAQSQYDMTERVAINALQPGDLVFFGTPGDVYHVGIYLGGGEMVDAPHTGADVRIESIFWSDLLAGGRVT